jgi:PAS domain S-box-containing protein
MAKALRPDVVLIDISMPRMNGLDAARIIRRGLPDSKVVIVTQNDTTVARRQARAVDAAAYVAKSRLAQDLIPTLDTLARHRNVEISTQPRAVELPSVGESLPDNGFAVTVSVPSGSETVTRASLSLNGDTVETSIPDGAISLESILCTEELHRRPSRPPDYEKEGHALVALARALADSPRTILQTLADTILEVSQAGSAGISLLTKDDGGKRFYWPAIAGRWKSHIGGGTPRDFGPCGDVLDRNTPLLFRHIERRYTYFQPVAPPVEEGLLIPFYVEGKAVGTIWAIAHDDRRKFDAEDERIMRSLGTFASSAYQMVASLDALKVRVTEHETAARASDLLAAIVDSSDDAIISKTLDGVITSWNKSAERLFGYTVGEAVGKHITFIIPPDRRQEETTIIERLKRGERVDHFETIRVARDGRKLELSLTISPVRDASGNVVGASKVARDITERKRAEERLRESEERLRALADELEAKVRLRTQQLEQLNAEALQQSEQLRELSNRLLQTQDDERRRIARELHDSAGQILSALSMNLATIAQRVRQDPMLSKSAVDSEELVQELNSEIRTMSYLLHPPLLDESGLSEAIRWYVQGLTERSGLSIETTISENFGRLPGEIELPLFRIVQECLTNIHRHSGSKTARIRLSRDTETVSLEIQDDGRGLPADMLSGIEVRRSGVGIAGMRERVHHFNGVLNIQSDDKGTKILVTAPIPRTATSDLEKMPPQARAAG